MVEPNDNIEEMMPKFEELMNQMGGNEFQEKMKEAMDKFSDIFKDVGANEKRKRV